MVSLTSVERDGWILEGFCCSPVMKSFNDGPSGSFFSLAPDLLNSETWTFVALNAFLVISSSLNGILCNFGVSAIADSFVHSAILKHSRFPLSAILSGNDDVTQS